MDVVKWLFTVCLLVHLYYAVAQNEADKLTEDDSSRKINPIFPSRGKSKDKPFDSNDRYQMETSMDEGQFDKLNIGKPKIQSSIRNQRLNNNRFGRRRVQKRIIRRPKSRRSHSRRTTTTQLPSSYSMNEQHNRDITQADNLQGQTSVDNQQGYHSAINRQGYLPANNAREYLPVNIPAISVSQRASMQHLPTPERYNNKDFFRSSEPLRQPKNIDQNPVKSQKFSAIAHDRNYFMNFNQSMPTESTIPFDELRSSSIHNGRFDIISLSPIPEDTLSKSLRKRIDNYEYEQKGHFASKNRQKFASPSTRLKTSEKDLETGIIGAFAGLSPPTSDKSAILHSRQLSPAFGHSSRQGRNRVINRKTSTKQQDRRLIPNSGDYPNIVHHFQPNPGTTFNFQSSGSNSGFHRGPTIGNSIFVNSQNQPRGSGPNQDFGRIDLAEGPIIIERGRLPLGLPILPGFPFQQLPNIPFNNFASAANSRQRVNSGGRFSDHVNQNDQLSSSHRRNVNSNLHSSFNSRDRYSGPFAQGANNPVFQGPSDIFSHSFNRHSSGTRRRTQSGEAQHFSANTRRRNPTNPVQENRRDQSHLGPREQLNRNRVNPKITTYSHKFGPAFTTIHGAPGEQDIIIPIPESLDNRPQPDISYTFQPNKPSLLGGQPHLPSFIANSFTSLEDHNIGFNKFERPLPPLLLGNPARPVHHNDINLPNLFTSNRPPSDITQPFSFFPELRPTVGRPSNLIPKESDFETQKPNSFSNLFPEESFIDDVQPVTFRPHVTHHQQSDISMTTFDNTQSVNQWPTTDISQRFPPTSDNRPTFPGSTNSFFFGTSGTRPISPLGFTDTETDREYSYGYAVNAPSTGDFKAAYEIKDPAGIVRGQYSLMQPDGLYRVVTYRADKANGFNANVKYYK